MAILKVWQRFEILDLLGEPHVGGSSVKPKTVVVTGTVKDEVKAIGTQTTWDFWLTGSEEPLSDWELLYVETDLDGVLIELTTDQNAGVGKVVYTLEVKKDFPKLLAGGDGSHANYTADFATGTLDVIDQIRIRNPSASTTANVRAVLVT